LCCNPQNLTVCPGPICEGPMTEINTIDDIQALLVRGNYVADRALATSLYLALRLGRPLFLEGEAGVGKTEIAKVLAETLHRHLVRLQCYEGLDVAAAVYEWNYAAQMINRDTKIFVSVDTGESSDPDIYKIAETPNDVHAGEIETSTSLAVRPHLVRMEYAVKSIPQFSNRYLNFTSKRGVAWYAYTKRISETGVMGDPTKASREKGQKMWQIMIGHLVAFVEELKRMTLEEIHQRRY